MTNQQKSRRYLWTLALITGVTGSAIALIIDKYDTFGLGLDIGVALSFAAWALFGIEE